MLVLIMFIILGVLSNDIPTAPDGGNCPNDRFLYKTGLNPSDLVERCVFKSKQQYDCLYYTFDSQSNCVCDASKGHTAQKIRGDTKIGCIAPNKIVLNCQQYQRYGQNGYSCASCPTESYYFKSYYDQNNVKVGLGCVKYIPNCEEYGVFNNNFQIGDDLTAGKVISCRKCQTSASAYSASTQNKFLLFGRYDNGLACPYNNQWKNCKEMQIVINYGYSSYMCKCSSSQLSIYYHQSYARLKIECVDSTDSRFDSNCQKFGLNNLNQVFCVQCKKPLGTALFASSLVSNQQRSLCIAQVLDGCQKHFILEGENGEPSQLYCGSCNYQTHHQLAIKRFQKSNLSGVTTIINLKICALKKRWIHDYSTCQLYEELNPDQDLSLKCKICYTSRTGTNNPPCYLNNVQKRGNCSNGQLSAKLFTDQSEICIIHGIIDNCQFYTSFDPTTSTATGCSQCFTGTTLAKTTASTTTKFCVPDSLLIKNCVEYQNRDFSCAACKSGLIYDPQTKTCPNDPNDSNVPKPFDKAPKILNCQKAIQIGTTAFCVSCSTGFTSVNSKCIASVPGCSTFNINGACTSCVPTYQLINGKCIPIPEHCLTVNQKGDCTQCQTGYLINSEKGCSESTINTCPAGYVPSADGNCVVVRVPIADCVRYTKNSKCEQCVEGYEPANNNLRCIKSVTFSVNDILKVKPCPPDTNKYSYRRNPSDPYGECVKVDLNCTTARDDGHCIGCNEGYFAHTDGLCYRLIYNN